MKQKLLLLISLLCFLTSNAKVNPTRNDYYIVPCEEDLNKPSCNLIPNPGFICTGDSLESFSDGDVFMWQDVNNLTTDINGALATGMGWNLPTAPANLTGANFASMLVDNDNKTTEGIAGKTFSLESGKKYALSFFLSSSALVNYRAYGGTYSFKIFLANCQQFSDTTSGNPQITGEKQPI